MSWMSRQPIWNRKRLEQLLSVLPPLITAEGDTLSIDMVATSHFRQPVRPLHVSSHVLS